jgi:hypothetical protein
MPIYFGSFLAGVRGFIPHWGKGANFFVSVISAVLVLPLLMILATMFLNQIMPNFLYSHPPPWGGNSYSLGKT